MGRVAAAGDNAAMESFHACLQKNVLNSTKVGDARGASHRDRHLDRTDLSPPSSQAPLGRLTPVEYEVIMTTSADQAA